MAADAALTLCRPRCPGLCRASFIAGSFLSRRGFKRCCCDHQSDLTAQPWSLHFGRGKVPGRALGLRPREAAGLHRPGVAGEERAPRPWRASEPAGPLPRPTATSHLCPPRPRYRYRHRPARNAEPGGQQRGYRHLPLGRGNLPPRPALELCGQPRWGGGEPASGGHWLRPRPGANPIIPLGHAPGPGTPLAPPPR